MLTTPCLCTRLRRAARGVTRVYDDALQGVGLTVAQYSLLRHLARLEQPSISTLAEALGLERSSLGRNLRPLQAEGLLELQGDASDQRNRLVLLTAAGRQRLEQGAAPWEAAQRYLLARLGEQRREQLMALLGELEDLG
ncbi:MarR family winged helix-turn-helix transcriptional regulator [Pseudomonas panipatensis]|uniref:DNA-binding transcriptional regulator, MarR family n=1 Tax=Pseudomonas panipatensis TaxID=428992 RepID=A0A1G8GH18_9PSED|nr:MarR family winged helix-turn-helix transcriptional regulator [Pseudomonas panipatensis]SDH93636.1 DNA-binding transcriptional regulator, MarR family [Pseudomonas panipatensis]SMP43352.1 transcriptional regulator, MarR family [Pseudomonas panipatensis]